MSADADTIHIPVLLHEVVEMMQAQEPGLYLDCTLGGAGHTRAILDAHPDNRVIAADRDSEAVKRAQSLSSTYGSRLQLHHAPFSKLKDVVPARSLRAAIADLGVSTDQLRGDRGFSFQRHARLDMRMDATQELSAFELVNQASETQLFRIFKEGGVGREARAIVQAIIHARPVETSDELAAVIAKAAYGKSSKRGVHPATVPFQALRMAVNDELGEIENLLDSMPELMAPAGRLAVITFHSLEDTLVTRRMRTWQSADSAPAWWPRKSDERKSLGKLLTPKGIRPGERECDENASARSARLRVFEFV